MIIEKSAQTRIHAKISALPAEFLERVRSSGFDDLGQPVRRMIARGGEPCRDVLRRAVAGEKLILCSFTPFTRSGPYKEFGPIFILSHGSGESVQTDRLAAGGASDYLRERFVIRAYSHDEEIIDASLVEAAHAQSVINRFSALPNAAFLHVRFPAYGCFACRLEVASTDAPDGEKAWTTGGS